MVMGWAAGVFGGGGAVLVVACFVGMGLLMWLLVRLTRDSAPQIGGQVPHRALAGPAAEGLAEPDGPARGRLQIGEETRSGPSGSGSVAP
jgi:hypothetical protein